jgi:hypothetical protein
MNCQKRIEVKYGGNLILDNGSSRRRASRLERSLGCYAVLTGSLPELTHTTHDA